MSLNDDELDRTLASLTDASPSPAVKANVMRRLRTDRTAPPVRRTWAPAFAGVRSWRLGLATAAVVIAAASIWLVLRPAPAPQSAGKQAAPAGTTAPSPPAGAGEAPPAVAQVEPAPGARATVARTASASRSAASRQSHLARDSGIPMIASASARVTLVEEMVIAPAAVPEPIAVAPLTLDPFAVERMEIPPLQVGPADPGEIKENRH